MKNPGHTKFIPVREFTDDHLPSPPSDIQRETLKTLVDLTVRLRVHWTSSDRPDEDDLSEHRGSGSLRTGTGFIWTVSGPHTSKPCPCRVCDGKVWRKYWTFTVVTAQHVVYNTQEAQQTRVDLFYDEESSQQDGTMKTVWAAETVWAESPTDVSDVLCVTHDEFLAERISSLHHSCRSLLDSYEQSLTRPKDHGAGHRFRKVFHQKTQGHVVIVSHPHGQPKKITVGKMSGNLKSFDGGHLLEYSTATCPGCSGAQVFPSDASSSLAFVDTIGLNAWNFVHSGTYDKTFPNSREPVNFGKNWA